MVCNEHHLLIWAKQKPFPFWPAKLISVDENNKVNVWFFGAHKRAVLTPKDCHMYSLAYPSEKVIENDDKQSFEAAKKVMLTHESKEKTKKKIEKMQEM